MNVRKAVFISLLILGVGLIFSSLFNIRQVNKNSGDTEQKNVDALSTSQKNTDTSLTSVGDYPTSSAINQAKEFAIKHPNFLALRKEAAQFGLSLTTLDVEPYKIIRDRLFANGELAASLKIANQEGIIVILGNRFMVSINAIHINVGASDDEIIKFLVKALPETKERKSAFEKLRKEATKFELNLMTWEEESYKEIRNRLLTNDKLASALRTANRQKIQVGLGDDFYIGADFVSIDVKASDEKIIEFLLGK